MTYTRDLNKEFSSSILPITSLLDDTVDWIRDNLTPEDIFDESTLEEWALSNGFIVEGSNDL